MKWPWSRRSAQPANRVIDVGSPVFAQFLTPGGLVDLAGVSVDERTAMGLSSIFRAVSLISGTLASLPLRSYREGAGGTPERVPSIFDEPDGPDGQTQFEWEETLFAHLVLHGKAGALKVKSEAGSLVRLPLVHPLSFHEEDPTPDEHPKGGLWFRVQLDDGTSVRLDADGFWYVPAISTDGQRGMGLLQVATGTIGTAIAGDRSSGHMFANGALISGLATPDYDDGLDITDDVPEIRRQLNRATSGVENAGAIALVNRRLKFTPWTMTAQQAQFLESRQFQIEEVSRFTGVPPHLLMQTEKQTSWGTGVDEQQRAMGRTVLAPWANRVEGRGSRLLANPRWVEIDFSGLERPSPDREIELDLSQVAAGVMTIDEYRAKRGWKPLPEEEPEPAPAPPADDDEPEDDDAPAE